MLLAAATAEAEARVLPAAEPGRAEALDRVRTAAKRLAQPVPIWRAYGLLVAAELLRAEDRDTPAHWSEAAAALAPLDRPYELAQVRYRWAAARLAAGDAPPATATHPTATGPRPASATPAVTAPGARHAAEPATVGPAREHAASLLARAYGTADRLAAQPLREAITLLAARARLPLPSTGAGRPRPVGAPAGAGTRRAVTAGRPKPEPTDLAHPAHAAAEPTAPTDADPAAGAHAHDPADAFRLTRRERDVLRLVAVGRSNR